MIIFSAPHPPPPSPFTTNCSNTWYYVVKLLQHFFAYIMALALALVVFLFFDIKPRFTPLYKRAWTYKIAPKLW